VGAPDCGFIPAVLGCDDATASNYDPSANINDGTCDYLGCTDGNSCNYDPQATIDDGSCQQLCLGCTSPEATNYDPIANVDDGSCTILDCFNGPVTFIFTKEDYATGPETIDQITANVGITRANQNGLFNSVTETEYVTDSSPAGTLWKLGSYDPADDPINDGQYSDWRTHHGGSAQNLPGQTSILYLIDDNIFFEIEWLAWTSSQNGGGFSYRRTVVNTDDCDEISAAVGCTDPEASNYDPSAIIDDGSCPVLGCTDFNACNYDPNANTDSGTCIFPGNSPVPFCPGNITVTAEAGEVGAVVCYSEPIVTGIPCGVIGGSFGSATETLPIIQDNYQSWLNLVGESFNFEYDSSDQISDGGNDMYDGGNRITFGSSIAYTSGAIVDQGDFEYFTTENPGMFTFYAEGELPFLFDIEGNLGADGNGQALGYSIGDNDGDNFVGYYKQVCNAGDPSVNHLIITTQNGN
ncbi:MAG: hypothetical protein AAF193_08815, partial [Bacteroidota bacterium]